MIYFTSELDRFYDLKLNCATHYGFFNNPKGMTAPHHHEEYEIYFLISGNRKYFVQNTIYTLQPNQVVIFKPNTPHQVTVNLNVPYERHLVYVTPQLFSEIINNNPSLKSIFDFQLFNLSDSDFAKALDIISEINKELERNDEYSQCMIKNLLGALLMFICRHNDTSNLVLNKSDLRIQSVINFILEHYSEHITLSDCAKIACMHYNTFSAVFQKETAIGFKDFLIRIRIDKGCELLETTDYSITKIAELTGFCTATHFTSTFKNLLNISPKEYRSRHQIEKLESKGNKSSIIL